MTRETKIGLLTGLGVIILIGVLLSQYLGGPDTAPRAASLSALGDSFRQRQLQPAGVDPAVRPVEGTLLAGVGPGMPGTASSAVDPLIARLPTRDGAAGNLPVDTALAAGPSVPPLIADPVSPQPAGPVVIGPAGNAGMPPVQLGQGSDGNGLERAIYVPADSSKPGDTTHGPLAGPVNNVPTGTFYSIAKGDTLTRIAKRFYKSATPANIARIVAANPAQLKDTKTQLVVGKKLLIPDAPRPVASTPQMPPTQVGPPITPPTTDTLVLRPDTGTALPPPGPVTNHTPVAVPVAAHKPTPTTYTVQSGDTLAKIAKKFLGSSSNQAVKRIMKANRLPDDYLEVGMALKIPSKAA